MKENDATGRKRRKIYIFMKKILKNEKCAEKNSKVRETV